MKKILILLLITSSLFSKAQQPLKYLIKTGKLFDSERGIFLSGMNILVNGSRIEEVKKDKDVTSEEKKNYKLVDLSDKVVTPGLIDSHTHLLFREELHAGMDYATMSLVNSLTMQGDAYRAIYGSVRAKAYLQAGITAVQDLGNSGKFGDVALRKTIDEGLTPGPRMRCAGQGLSSEGGQLPGLIYQHRDIAQGEYRIVKGVDDARQAVRENVNQGADVIKVYSNNTPNRTALSVEEMQTIVKEAHRYGIRVTAHATDDEAVRNAVIAGVDGIEHGYDISDTTLALMAAKKVYLIPTDGDKQTFLAYAGIVYPNDKNSDQQITRFRARYIERLKRALKAGVPVAFGSDDYIDVKMPFAELSKRTLIGYFEAGIPVTQILQFATINASRQLNWSENIGIIKRGYYADIVAFDNSLTSNIEAILNSRFVMKDGIIYKAK